MKRVRLLGREYRTDYDAVIIGAGIGGLFCANLLADAGLRVLLIEQHYVLGGYCSTFREKRFIFDSATHFYPLLGNPSTLTGKLLQKLQIPTEWIKMDPVDRFHFCNGETFVVPADFSQYLIQLKKKFPHQADSLDRFFAEVKEAYLYGLLHYFKEISNQKVARYLDFTVRQKLDEHFQDAKLKAYLIADHSHWGSLPEETSFVFDSMLRLAYFLGNYYPRGSSQAFADDLGNAFRRRGGDILLYTQVEKIQVEKGRARGVIARTRSRRNPQTVCFRAPVIISNADLVQTYERLLGPEQVSAVHLQKLRRLRPSIACYLMHMGLTGMDRSRLEEVEGYYWKSWDPEDLKRTFFKVFFTTLLDPGVAPPGHDILIVQKWCAAEYATVEDWTLEKQRTEDYIMDQLRTLLPGIDRHIVVRLSASAYTSHRYTLNWQGSMLGWSMSPDQLGSHRPDNTTPVEDLYLVGHWTRPGGGITPVILSAQRVASLILTGGRVPDSKPHWLGGQKI